MALELEDFELLGHISEGDFIAIEAKCPLKCLISLKIGTDHPVRRKRNIQVRVDDENMDESMVFFELVEDNEECVENGTHLFKGHVNPKIHVFLILCKKWRRKRI